MALVILVILCTGTFLQLLDAQQLKSGNTNPRLDFEPKPPQVASSLIWYNTSDPLRWQLWTNKLSEFLNAYKRDDTEVGTGGNVHSCDFNLPSTGGKVCGVDINVFEACNENNHFGYHKSAPCIFLKLNNIIGWKPEFYNSTDSLPQDMPQDLKDHIKNRAAFDKDSLNMVWVSCQGENPADAEFLGPIMYLPYRGFPGYYFPYTNQKGYLSPLVAVHLQRPRTGILFIMECRVWAKNIQYNREEGLGSVHIEIMID